VTQIDDVAMTCPYSISPIKVPPDPLQRGILKEIPIHSIEDPFREEKSSHKLSALA